MPCKLHPRYKGKTPPRSTREGCTCAAVYAAAKRKRNGLMEVLNNLRRPVSGGGTDMSFDKPHMRTGWPYE